uniref:Uncharacterized protein n=1 Tax=Arundo donax TaxID=35708 RepID=A0A0A9GF42_ARUDO
MSTENTLVQICAAMLVCHGEKQIQKVIHDALSVASNVTSDILRFTDPIDFPGGGAPPEVVSKGSARGVSIPDLFVRLRHSVIALQRLSQGTATLRASVQALGVNVQEAGQALLMEGATRLRRDQVKLVKDRLNRL